METNANTNFPADADADCSEGEATLDRNQSRSYVDAISGALGSVLNSGWELANTAVSQIIQSASPASEPQRDKSESDLSTASQAEAQTSEGHVIRTAGNELIFVPGVEDPAVRIWNSKLSFMSEKSELGERPVTLSEAMQTATLNVEDDTLPKTWCWWIGRIGLMFLWAFVSMAIILALQDVFCDEISNRTEFLEKIPNATDKYSRRSVARTFFISFWGGYTGADWFYLVSNNRIQCNHVSILSIACY